VRSKQLDARFEPVLMNKSKEHLMVPDRTYTQTQPSPRACYAPAKCEMRAFVAVGNRDAHILMVWTVYQVCLCEHVEGEGILEWERLHLFGARRRLTSGAVTGTGSATVTTISWLRRLSANATTIKAFF
jgi:hypothetical protein